jgi:hypothetical protein
MDGKMDSKRATGTCRGFKPPKSTWLHFGAGGLFVSQKIGSKYRMSPILFGSKDAAGQDRESKAAKAVLRKWNTKAWLPNATKAAG